MVALNSSGHFSAKVRLFLHIGSERISVAQIGGNRIVFAEPVVLSGSSGEIRAQIDENEHRWLVNWQASDEPRKVIPADYQCVS